MLTFLFCCICSVLCLGAHAEELDPKFQLLPQPQRVEMLSKQGVNWSQITFIHRDKGQYPVMGEMLSRLPRFEKEGIGIELILTDEGVASSPEAYILELSQDGIRIKSRGEAGLFYGCVTLEQLMQDSYNNDITIPELIIEDSPQLAYRAVHFDVKHHLSKSKYYYDLIDKLSRYKINAIIWEIEDKLKYTRRPEIASPNALTMQEMLAISRYAKERHIEISPLVQGLGHASFILKHHAELRESPHSDWEFCPSNPKSYELQYDLYLDAMQAMPHGKYLHVGGDEVGAIGICPRCRATGKNAFQLQMEWLRKVCDFAEKHTRIPIFWDDMPLKHAGVWYLMHNKPTKEQVDQEWNTKKLDEAMDLFPKNCIYMRWNYGNPTTYCHLKLLDWYAQKGLKVMAATAAASGDSPFMPRNDSHAGFIKAFSSLSAKNNYVGILSCSWDDGSPHWETVVRGFIAQGEFAWNPDARNVEEFKQAHAQREFGLTQGELHFIDRLEEQAACFDGLLVQSGRRRPAWQVRAHRLIDLPQKEQTGEWSKKYAAQIAKANIMMDEYSIIAQAITLAKTRALSSRYTLEIYEQNNELFSYPARLIQALHHYDIAEGEAKSLAKQQLVELTLDFETMRKRLEKVYSQTRFMEQPKGYIEDNNHHKHLSSLSLNSDWLYLYEIDMIKAIRAQLEKL